MVGGTIIGITRKDGKTHIHVANCPHHPKHTIKAENLIGCPRPDTNCIYTSETKTENGEKISINIGDTIWWQSGHCYWTPQENRNRTNSRTGIDHDIKLTKHGYSH